jgi:hypothetical protein
VDCGVGGSIVKILVGLQRVGVVGLHEAFTAVDESGLTEHEAIASQLFELVSRRNYISESAASTYRQALLREFLRYKGQDIREHYSEIDVLVRGAPGEERDQFVDTLRSVFSEFELKPVVQFVTPGTKGPHPQLVMDDEAVVAGNLTRSAMKPLIKKRLSDW